jgi:hypothetical protein
MGGTGRQKSRPVPSLPHTAIISVLADRYQRVYRRKIYFPQEEISVTDPSENQHYQTQDIIEQTKI